MKILKFLLFLRRCIDNLLGGFSLSTSSPSILILDLAPMIFCGALDGGGLHLLGVGGTRGGVDRGDPVIPERFVLVIKAILHTFFPASSSNENFAAAFGQSSHFSIDGGINLENDG